MAVMHAGPKFKPFNATAEDLDSFYKSKARPIFKSRLQPSNLSTSFKRAELTLEDMRPFQVAAGWRLVRTHAMAKSHIGDMEPLTNLGDERLWTHSCPDASPGTRTTLSRNLGDIWAGLSLLPNEDNKAQFANAVAAASKLLNLTHNPRQPLMGEVSVYGMQDSKTILRFFPTYLEVAQYEQEFMSVMAETLLFKGHTAIITELQTVDGFSRAEAMSLVPLARNFAIQGIELDAEFDQKMMIARTEGYINRAQEAADLRSEIQGLKHLATVQGIARMEPADPLQVFATLVQELTDEDKASQRLEIAEAPVSDNKPQE